eukprot:CAMPEP_0204875438 /NCGR_PEP_ID=MMETSP1348-20121228/45938_1 /ASSEMBLY_ACC=CAM_ASM_000700 /TAXON_ID=215587 /ORGANISM="Aplanochytrium stocchinoi, Strain GSBS06" /LENGTH=265 /DNA_ID=CAMNT_0052031881 /DNA_START=35 /DNA_END=832 /DNA_ORIENTATION=-
MSGTGTDVGVGVVDSSNGKKDEGSNLVSAPGSTDSGEDKNRNKNSYSSLSARLVSIGQAGKKGELSAYGPNKEATLKKIVSMRKSQVEIFRKHMGLELSLSEKVDKETEDGEVNSKKFSEVFQKEFHEKEKELQSITTMLDSLSTALNAVNKETRASLLPTEPHKQTSEDQEHHDSNYKEAIEAQNKTKAKNKRMNRAYMNMNMNTYAYEKNSSKNDSEWKRKLALNPSRTDRSTQRDGHANDNPKSRNINENYSNTRSATPETY